MDRAQRRFGLGDLMIPITALGVAIWGVRNLWLGLVERTAEWAWYLTPVRLVIATPLTVVCPVAASGRSPAPPPGSPARSASPSDPSR